MGTNPADKQYIEHLRQLARSILGNDVILYTTDGGNDYFMSRGSLNSSDVLTVGDFGPGTDPSISFTSKTIFGKEL